MSAEIPPDPITDTFNPAAWNVPELTDEERALLDANYIKFPIAQNSPITFPSSITAPTQVNTDNSTKVATTAWGNLFWAYVRSIANTWSGTQTFSSTLTAATIAPTTPTGTLNIGNAVGNIIFVGGTASRTAVLHLGDGNNAEGGIHIGNGLASSNPVNILYSDTDAGASGEINLGSATGTVNLRCPLTPTLLTYNATTGLGTDKIGQRVVATGTPPLITVGTPQTILSFAANTLSVGIWIFSLSISRPAGTGGYIASAINTTAASFTGALFLDTVQVGNLSPENANSWVVVVTNAATVYYLIGQTDINAGGTSSWSGNMFAIRIA